MENIISSEKRQRIMGVCTFGIIICHAVPNGVHISNTVDWILNLGNYCVDVFFFYQE